MAFQNRLYVDLPLESINDEILNDCLEQNTSKLRKNKDQTRAILSFETDNNPRQWISDLYLIQRTHAQATLFYNSDPDWNWEVS